ncbi:MAG: ZIP family metal transporter [candidate division Zixibacteria bacterium]|nr:ZIP family metal transporter [candidate division Zixibacteria bacterium]
MILWIGAATVIATFLGGLFALGLKDKLHLITGFSAGAMIGVAFFDLLPEAFELGDASQVPLAISIGFALYMILDRMLMPHSHHDDECGNRRHKGALGAGSLALHSFLDGSMIGLAFQVSDSVGLVVALAILTHDFSDGINTVTMIVRSGGDRRRALKWLLVDAIAPVAGMASATLYSVPSGALGTALGVFCGCFLYIGGSDLLPESHHAHPKALTTLMTFAGMLALYLVIQMAK